MARNDMRMLHSTTSNTAKSELVDLVDCDDPGRAIVGNWNSNRSPKNRRRSSYVRKYLFHSVACLREGRREARHCLDDCRRDGFGWLSSQLSDRPAYIDPELLNYYRYVERSQTAFQDAP